MSLLDLTSDLTKAFSKKPAGGKLEKLINDPNSSQLNYDATPKQYQIPNDGQGVGIKYDPYLASHVPQSDLGNINTSMLPGKFNNESDTRIEGSKSSGRHDKTDIEIQSLAPTPAKLPVEPIIMSATPVKQGKTPTKIPSVAQKAGVTPNPPLSTPKKSGVTPNPIPPTREKMGVDITKIPLVKHVENSAVEVDSSLYGLTVGPGTLVEMDSGRSLFDIDDIPISHWSNGANKPSSAFWKLNYLIFLQ